MNIFIAIILYILGIFLILVEVFLIPGMALGITIGSIFTIYGILHTFYYLRFYEGLLLLVLTIILIILSIICIVKSKLLNKIALDTQINSTIKIEKILNIAEGDEGVTISRLNPIGKVEVNNIIIEGKSIGYLIAENTPIIVLKVTPTQLVVKKKKAPPP